MMFLFTSNNLIGSKAIQWALDEPCSHFAIVFDEMPGGHGVVFHSKFTGVQFDWWNNFRKRNRVHFALRLKVPDLQTEENIYQTVVKNFYGSSYDFAAFLAFGYFALRRKFTGRTNYIRTNFSSNSYYLCTEIGTYIQKIYPNFVPGPPVSEIISPYELYLKMQKSPDLAELQLKGEIFHGRTETKNSEIPEI